MTRNQTTLRSNGHTATITFADGPATHWLLGIADELKQSTREARAAEKAAGHIS